MRYKAFGKTGLEVSELCLGTWGIGGAGWDQNPEETKMDAIRASFEQGVNIFDTAPAYNAGAAERILGETLEKMGVRKDVILSTKCGNDFVNGQYVHCGKRDHILAQCDASLRNLRTYETMDSRNRFYKFFREPGWSKAQKLLGVMDEISAARGGVPLSEIAVNWALQKSFLTTALFGTQHRARAIENCHALDWTLNDAEVAKLDQALVEFGI